MVHLFGDKNNWAIVFEKIGYSEAAGEVQSELNFIGNCINYKKENNGQREVLSNTTYITLISGQELEKIQMPENDSEDYFEMINPKTKKVKVRNKQVTITLDATTYAKYKIKLVDSNNPKGFVSFGNLARYLYATQPKSFCANPNEIRSMLPKNLPFIMTIDKFHFKSSYDPKNLPSTQELYIQIADVLMSLDSTLWKPTKQPNNEWYNWESIDFNKYYKAF